MKQRKSLMLPFKGRGESVLGPCRHQVDSFYSPFMTEKEVHCQIFKSTDNTKLFQLDRCHNKGQHLTKLSG